MGRYGSTGPLILYWLREGSQRSRLKSDLWEKLEWWGGNRNKMQPDHYNLLHTTHEQGIVAVGSNSSHQLREGKLCHRWNNNLFDNAAVRIVGNGREKENKRRTHHRCLLHANRDWGIVVVGSYSPCGLVIRRDGDSPDQNPIVGSYHQVVAVALIMRRAHSCILGNLIS